MPKLFSRLAVLAVLCAFPFAGHTGPVLVELADVQHHTARLEIQAADGKAVTYTPEDLEDFPTYRIETKTPWREEAAIFEGVLLRDVLEAHGLSDLPQIRAIAENDYSTSIEREIWEQAPVLIATRVNGRPLSRRERGPLLIVVPQEEFERHEFISERHLVWMISEIRPES